MAQYIGNSPTTVLVQSTEVNDLTSIVTWANVPDTNITESSVTQHQAALSITESQISDLQTYLTSETVTSLTFLGTTLTFNDENGTANNIDLSILLDEDARAIASGVLDAGTGIVTFTRDDATTFTLDLSGLLDDTNLVTSVNGQAGVVVLGTDEVSEGSTNLYYTDARVGSYLTTNSYATESYVTTAISGKADSSSLATVAISGDYDDLINTPTIPSLTLQQVDTNGTATESYTNITVLQFDEDSGFDVTNPSAGVAKVAMNSTFKYWEIDGVSALTAVGLDTVNFVSGTGITMSANDASTPKTFTIGTDLALEELNNVTLTSATSGQVLKYDGSGWVNGDDEGGATVSGTAPLSPAEGTLWFDNVTTGQLYTYVGTTWLSTAGLTTLEFSSVGDLSDVDITTTAPTNGQALVWDGTNFVPGDVATVEVNDLTAAVVWANVPDTNITQSSVTQHQAALSITESQISDLQSYLTSETDPIYTASSWYTTTNNSLNWDNAYTWGDHSVAGYLTNLSTLSTDDLLEGATNLYFTTARVDSEIDSYVTGGTGVTVTSGEIAIGQDVGTNANVTFNDLTLSGNLTVNGTTTTVNTTNLAVSDNMIYLADGNTTTNIDIGFAGNYNDGAYAHAGLFRDASDGRWKFFDSYVPEPDAAVDIDTNHASFNLAPLQAGSFIGDLTGNVTGTVSSLSNHSTTDLAEGTNLYYTDARVGTYLTANSYATESYVTTAISGKADSSSLATVATSGDYTDLINTPTIPSTLTDLGITDGTSGQVLTTDGAGNFTFADTAVAYGDSDVATYLTTNGYATETYVDNTVSTKQDTLVSGTNIKTINGNSIIGSGDLVVTPPEQSIDTTTTTAELMDSFATIDYRSAEYFVTTSSTDGFSAFKVLVVHDDTNAYYTTYAVVGNTSSGDVSVSIASNTVNVYFTATNASTQVKFIRTTISGAAIAQMPSSLSTGSGTIDLASDYGTLDLNG